MTEALPREVPPSLHVADQPLIQALITHGTDIITLLSEHGDILYQSPAAIRALGVNRSPQPGRAPVNIRDVLHPDDYLTVARQALQTLPPGASTPLARYRVRHLDGRWRWMESTVINLLDEPSVRAIAVSARDVTERHLNETRAKSLHAVTTSLTSTYLPEQVVEAIVKQGLPIMGAAGGALAILTAQGDAVEVLGSLGHSPGVTREWQRLALTDRTPLTDVTRSAQPVFLNHTDWPAHYPHLGHPHPVGVSSVAALPLIVDGRVVGALALSFTEDQVFDEPEREYLGTLAAQCAQALNRGWLYRELEDRETRSRKLTQHSPTKVTILAPDGTIQYESDSAQDLLGYPVNELVGRNVQAFIHPEDWKAVMAALSRAVEQPGEPVRITCRFRHKDGSWRWLEALGRALLDDPHVQGILVNCWDVTSRVEALHAMRDSERQYRLLAENSSNLICVYDTQGALTYVSPAVQRLLDFTPAEFQMLPITDFIHPDDLPHVRDLIKRHRAGEMDVVRVEYRGRHRDGRFVWLESSLRAIRDQDSGDQAEFHVATQDITERRRAEDEIHRNEAFLRRVMHSSADCITILDDDGRFLFMNQGGQQLRRIDDLTPLLGTSWVDCWSPDQHETVRAALEEARRGQPATFRGHTPTATGQEKWWDVVVTGVRAEDGRLERLLVVSRDVTAQKAAEQEQQDHNHILRMTAQAQPLPAVLNEIALMVERQAPGHLCSIMLARDGRLSPAAAPSIPPELLALRKDWDIRVGSGVCGTAAATGETVIVEDITTHPATLEFRHLLLPAGVRAAASTPILDGEGQVLGVLTLYAPNSGPFTRVSLSVLEKARHLAAIALEQRRLTERLKQQAQHDALTGLPNRALFTARLNDTLTLAEHDQQPLALLFIDLDDFKGVNDTLGHTAGDQVLLQVAERLASCVRRGDTLARLAGDEFTVILPHTNENEAVTVAQRILDELRVPLQVDGRELFVSASVGVSVYPHAGLDAEALQQHADMAMYHAKQRKLGLVVFEREMNRRVYERLHLMTYLRRAVELNELELHYQPLVRLDDQTVVGVEALLRWQHPELGTVSPAQFIPLAEESGLIVPIGEWVLREACRQGVRWLQQGHPPVRIAVNVSALQFDRGDFVETVARTLEETGLPAERLELELTERVVMNDVQGSVERMTRLRELGVSLSIDDFGTGYSSLSYLPRLPINILKIDRSFVMNLHHASATFPVVKAIISLAQSLGLTTVAEGIETKAELDVLRELECGLGQGYHFARPLPAASVNFESVNS